MPFDELEIEFPEMAEVIKRSRKVNFRLDEICSDYELLLEDYRRLAENPTSTRQSPCWDVEETLSGLLDEIAKALGAKRRLL